MALAGVIPPSTPATSSPKRGRGERVHRRRPPVHNDGNVRAVMDTTPPALILALSIRPLALLLPLKPVYYRRVEVVRRSGPCCWPCCSASRRPRSPPSAPSTSAHDQRPPLGGAQGAAPAPSAVRARRGRRACRGPWAAGGRRPSCRCSWGCAPTPQPTRSWPPGQGGSLQPDQLCPPHTYRPPYRPTAHHLSIEYVPKPR